MVHKSLARAVFVAVLSRALVSAGGAPAPQPLPRDAPTLKEDKIVMVVGSSVSVRRYKVHPLPQWTGGHNRVPPQCTNGQNVFFRVFEMLNDHENMCWRRLGDKDWVKSGTRPGPRRGTTVSDWTPTRKLPYRDASPRIAYACDNPAAWAEIHLPAGYEKLDLIYTSDPNGDRIHVTINGRAPAENALVDTFQDTAVPALAKLSPAFETLDSHGKPRQIRPPRRGIPNIVELRARYRLDPKQAHAFRIRRATADPGKRILVWGVVYWRGHCVQVVQRAKGGINCGDLPRYPAVQEVMALRPDYLLMEAINVRHRPGQVTRSLEPGFAWCARHKNRFKVLVYSTCQASSKAFRAWFRDPQHKPPYGGDPAVVTDENADACHRAVIELCRKYGFPLVDVGRAVDAYLAEHPTVRFVPHILNDWYHPNQWGAALFGQTIGQGIRQHWPELPVRPVNLPPAPK